MHENNLLFKKYLVVLQGGLWGQGVGWGMRLEEQTPATHNRTRGKQRCQASLSQVGTATIQEQQTCHSDTGELWSSRNMFPAAGEQAHQELEVARKQLDGGGGSHKTTEGGHSTPLWRRLRISSFVSDLKRTRGIVARKQY